MGLNCPEDMAAQAGLLELPTTELVEMMRSLRLEDVPKVRSVCRQLRDMQLRRFRREGDSTSKFQGGVGGEGGTRVRGTHMACTCVHGNKGSQ